MKTWNQRGSNKHRQCLCIDLLMLKGIGKDEGMQPDLMFKLRKYVNFDD